jgi:type I restriction enzyme S subunit
MSTKNFIDELSVAKLNKTKLGQLFTTITPRKSKKSSRHGKFPVIDQAQSFISGYSDETELVNYDIPFIVFGDHTKIVKLIDFPFIAASDGIQIIKAIRDIDTRYLYYLLSIAAIQIGDHGYSRHFKYLKSFIVNYHVDIQIQHKVGLMMANLDAQLVNNEEIEGYKAIREGLIHDLFTRGINPQTGRLREESTVAPELYNISNTHTFPKDWQCLKLNNLIADIIDNRGKTPPTINVNGIPLIETASINSALLEPDYSKVTKFITLDTYKTSFRKYLDKDDILISTVGEYAGASAILTSKHGIIAQNVVGIRINQNNHAYFIYYWFKTIFFKQSINQVMMNSTQPSINVNHILNFNIQIPSLEEQQMIANRLKAIDNLIITSTQKLAKLEKLKQGLIQNIFCF